MTKVTIIGEAKPIEKKKPIEFVKVWTSIGIFPINESAPKPKEYNNIELISFNYLNDVDLMFAYNEIRSNGICVLGHFNDGIVEGGDDE